MKVGVNLINYGPGAGPTAFTRWAQLAEALGYHLLMISDHLVNTPDVETLYPVPFYDPFITAAWLASQTRRLEIGTTVVILPYRHPLEVARLATNLAHLSDGRFILGIGAGWARQEFAALGVPFHARGAITDDYLDAIDALWRGRRSYHGRHVAFDDVAADPPPAEHGYPPIWVGGNTEAGRRRAVRLGAPWHPINIRVAWLRDIALPDLRKIADDAEKPVPALCPRIRIQLTDTPLDDEERLAGQGTLDQVRSDLEALQELGAVYVLLDPFTGDPEASRHAAPAWAALATLADRVLDLERERLR
jgi:probable F420-dependent oxidoreductase